MSKVVLDTSALIRFFTRDDELKAARVKTLLESSSELVLLDAVLLELVYTVLKVYKLSKAQVLVMLHFLLSRPNIHCAQEMRTAIALFEKLNLSITDCLVIAHAQGHAVASFDQNLLKQPSVKSVWK
jgi:predicted nucleic acid-binding protein